MNIYKNLEMKMVFYSNNYYGHLDLAFYLFSNLLKLES